MMRGMDIPNTKTEAIKLLGGRSNFARAVGCSRQSVAYWREELTPAAKSRIKLALMEKEQEKNTRPLG